MDENNSISLGKRIVAYALIYIASWLTALAKHMMSPSTIAVAILPLPGWYVIDCHIIRQSLCLGRLRGVQWETWEMPAEWTKEMEKYK